MTNFTPEMLEKAKAAKSADELLALAKENEVEMTEDEAKTYFAQLNPKSGELDDDDLDNVAGGACDNYNEDKAKIGDRVCINGFTCESCGHKNPTATVTNIDISDVWSAWEVELDCCGKHQWSSPAGGRGWHVSMLRKI